MELRLKLNKSNTRPPERHFNLLILYATIQQFHHTSLSSNIYSIFIHTQLSACELIYNFPSQQQNNTQKQNQNRPTYHSILIIFLFQFSLFSRTARERKMQNKSWPKKKTEKITHTKCTRYGRTGRTCSSLQPN